jgi:hypothetical protein
VSPDGVRVAFQLDRFEQTGDDRLEIAGRWYGVRGLRFVRPALTVQTSEGERNLLAVLEHKPWAVEEGESWIAAFPWVGESPDPGSAELAVAPSVVVALVNEGAGEATAPVKPNVREQLQESEVRARRLDSEVAWLREEREALIADKRAAEEEAAALRSELREARGATDAAIAERDAARQERDDAGYRLESAVREGGEASRAREELESARDEALAERDTAVAARDAALSEIESAQRERAQAIAEREALVAQRDEALEQSRGALAERDAALGRGSGFPAVSAADLGRQPHAPAPAPAPRQEHELHDWTPRAIALGALILLFLIVILLLRFL